MDKQAVEHMHETMQFPEDWRTGLIVPIWKRKGHAQDPWKYRGITLLSHIMKLLDNILDKR